MPLHFTIYDLKVFCTQPQQRGTWTQPFHGDLQRLSCKAHKNHAQPLHKLQLQNRISTPKRKDDDFEALLKGILKENHQHQNEKKLLPKHHSQLSCCHYNAIYDSQLESITHAPAAANLDAAIPLRSAEAELQNTIELRTTVTQIAAPKPDLDAQAEKRRF